MRLRRNEYCPIHRSVSCCGRELIPKPRLIRLGVQGARTALARTGLPQQKQQLLRDIISVLENPSKGTASIKLPQEM